MIARLQRNPVLSTRNYINGLRVRVGFPKRVINEGEFLTTRLRKSGYPSVNGPRTFRVLKKLKKKKKSISDIYN